MSSNEMNSNEVVTPHTYLKNFETLFSCKNAILNRKDVQDVLLNIGFEFYDENSKTDVNNPSFVKLHKELVRSILWTIDIYSNTCMVKSAIGTFTYYFDYSDLFSFELAFNRMMNKINSSDPLSLSKNFGSLVKTESVEVASHNDYVVDFKPKHLYSNDTIYMDT